MRTCMRNIKNEHMKEEEGGYNVRCINKMHGPKSNFTLCTFFNVK